MTAEAIAISAAALEALLEPALLIGADGRLAFANASAITAFGAAGHVGRPLASLLVELAAPTADGAVFSTADHPVVRAVEARQPLIGLDLSLSLASGVATYQVTTTPVRDGAGGTVTVFRDVSVARRLERDAAEHAARLEALADLVDQAIFIVSADGRALFLNAQAREQLGDVPAEMLSPLERARAMDLTELDGRPVTADDLPFNRAMRGETVAGMTLLIRHPARGIRRMRVSASPLRRASGAVYATVIAWKDVTEEHRALAGIETARQSAEDASRLKDEFIAALSHELRTPLQPILGWTEVLRRHSGIDDVTARALEAIRRNVRHQVRLVDDLLDLSRIMHGKLALRFEAFDLREQVRLAAEAFEETASLKRVRLSAELPPAALPMWGDGERVHQIVTNLIANALKFTPAAGRVDVRLAVSDAIAVIHVSDTGEGIAAADLAIIWEPFRQGRHTPRRGGLGIGLDLVRRLTELHGGRVAVSSEGPGRGASFRVELPLAAPAAPITAGAVGLPRRLVDRSVLLIEDNADTRDVLKLMLEVEGAHVETAACGEEGVQAAGRRPPDLVLCDIGLPDIDGMEVVRRLRSRHPGAMRCIALTGYGQAEDVRQAIKAGFDAHLTKPINLDQLMTLLSGDRSIDSARGFRVD
jgi:signal transduction histidine kinase/ActR/RegA family two-component response regulator